MNRSIIFIIFICMFAADLAGEWVSSDLLTTAVKPFLLPLLAVLFVLSYKDRIPKRKIVCVMIPLMFSWAGDIVIQIPDYGNASFVTGLFLFLCAHVSYTILFLYDWPKPFNKTICVRKPYFAAIPIAATFAFFVCAGSRLGDMTVPVVIYSCVIVLMCISVINRYGGVTNESFYFLVAGAAAFFFSDFILAFNKFVSPMEKSAAVNMFFYVVAQYFMVAGFGKGKERVRRR